MVSQDAIQMDIPAFAPTASPMECWPIEASSHHSMGCLPPQSNGSGQDKLTRWIWCFIALGITARVVRFALNFPLGSDEAYQASNLIDKGFLDLLGPLNYEQ